PRRPCLAAPTRWSARCPPRCHCATRSAYNSRARARLAATVTASSFFGQETPAFRSDVGMRRNGRLLPSKGYQYNLVAWLPVSHGIYYTVNMAQLQKRAYRYRCYPTPPQAAVLARTFGCARFVYDWALRLRTDAYYERQERLNYVDLSAALTTLKQQSATVWLNEVSSVPIQQALRHLETAFRNFFAGRARYPNFHKKHGKQS